MSLGVAEKPKTKQKKKTKITTTKSKNRYKRENHGVRGLTASRTDMPDCPLCTVFIV